jgi:hypothetical protein
MYFSHGQQLLLPLLRFFFHRWQPGHLNYRRDRTWEQQHTSNTTGERMTISNVSTVVVQWSICTLTLDEDDIGQRRSTGDSHSCQ